MPVLELPGNPSSFAVYAHVRGLVLENAARQAQGVYLATTQPLPSDSDTEDEQDRGREAAVPIPKVCILPSCIYSVVMYRKWAMFVGSCIQFSGGQT